MDDTNGWEQYQKLVLAELVRLNEGVEGLKRQMTQVQTQVAVLKVKSGLWGLVAGAIPVLILVLLQYLGKR